MEIFAFSGFAIGVQFLGTGFLKSLSLNIW